MSHFAAREARLKLIEDRNQMLSKGSLRLRLLELKFSKTKALSKLSPCANYTVTSDALIRVSLSAEPFDHAISFHAGRSPLGNCRSRVLLLGSEGPFLSLPFSRPLDGCKGSSKR